MASALRINFETGGEELIEIADPAPIVPQFITRRQALLTLDSAGLLDDAESLIGRLPRASQIE